MICLSYLGTEVEISLKGAELKSIRKAQQEYIWQADPEYWGESAPWLFPVVCDTKGDKLVIDGSIYPMPRHGFIRERNFTSERKTQNTVLLRYDSREEDKAFYPYSFSFMVEYVLKENELEVSCCIVNRSDGKMYYCVGWHPGFCCPAVKELKFSDYRLVFEKTEDCILPTLVDSIRQIDRTKPNIRMQNADIISLNYELFDRDVLVFDHIRSRAVSLEGPAGRWITVRFPGYDMLGVWTIKGKKAPYLCIEPWQGTCAYTDEENKLEYKAGVKCLNAGESYTHKASVVLY